MSTAVPARVRAHRAFIDPDEKFLDLVWRNGRIIMMLSPLWAHVVGIDMSPVARLSQRMDLDLVRCRQLALMRRAAPPPSRIDAFVPVRFACVRHRRAVRTGEEPVQ